jgi:hypothetical protein
LPPGCVSRHHATDVIEAACGDGRRRGFARQAGAHLGCRPNEGRYPVPARLASGPANRPFGIVAAVELTSYKVPGRREYSAGSRGRHHDCRHSLRTGRPAARGGGVRPVAGGGLRAARARAPRSAPARRTARRGQGAARSARCRRRWPEPAGQGTRSVSSRPGGRGHGSGTGATADQRGHRSRSHHARGKPACRRSHGHRDLHGCPLMAAGCEPRAGLREMPSRNLRDDLPYPRAGRRRPHRCPDRKRQPLALTPSTRRHGHPGRRLTHRRPGNKKRATMTTGSISRTAHLLALTNKGNHVRPGPPGMSHQQGGRGLLSRLLSRSLAVCADHATCVTPAHPVRQEARKGAQRDRADQPRST